MSTSKTSICVNCLPKYAQNKLPENTFWATGSRISDVFGVIDCNTAHTSIFNAENVKNRQFGLELCAMKLEIFLIFLIKCISAFPGPSSYNTFYDAAHNLEESKFVKILKYRLNRSSPVLLLSNVIKSHSSQNFESARNFIKLYNGHENLRSKRFLSFRNYHRFEGLFSIEVST